MLNYFLMLDEIIDNLKAEEKEIQDQEIIKDLNQIIKKREANDIK
jgi:hypothetical protein